MKKIVLAMSVATLVVGFNSAVLAQTAPPVPAATPDLTQGIIDEGKQAATEAVAPKPAMAPSKMKAKKVKTPASVMLKITNARSIAVTALSIGLSGSGTGKNVVTKPLAPGKSATVKLDTKKGCTFDVRGAFEDEGSIEADGIDFCADHALVLKD